ncbi:edc2p [Saccharomyces arboricola H-6]|uniref:Edc2p n=1 Tax=Saccharomyces arboricola (strain H-6 / AS 2.3317 / CBS 10644) TaxID=1160507 RepID=J8Q8X6_SACAR|nr:edc2p [Saccharomyces arboricola H-6]
MSPDTKHSSKPNILTKNSSPSTKEHIRPRKAQVVIPPAQNLPNGDKPNFGRSTKQHREPRERSSTGRNGDAETTTMVTVNIDGFLGGKSSKKKLPKNNKRKSRHHDQNMTEMIDSKSPEAARTVFAGASFTTDIPHEAALPKPSFV